MPKHYLISCPFLKKKLNVNLSAKPGKNLFIKTARLPVKVSTKVRLRFWIAWMICPAHSSEDIIAPSSIGDSPCDLASLFKAALRILELVKPGHTHITWVPVCNSSVLMDSSQPFRAYLDAE